MNPRRAPSGALTPRQKLALCAVGLVVCTVLVLLGIRTRGTLFSFAAAEVIAAAGGAAGGALAGRGGKHLRREMRNGALCAALMLAFVAGLPANPIRWAILAAGGAAIGWAGANLLSGKGKA